ncbi:MAG: YceI family protein [Pedobacter sp.]|nr:MAG: YceI family protein [Pedobacter sp.]
MMKKITKMPGYISRSFPLIICLIILLSPVLGFKSVGIQSLPVNPVRWVLSKHCTLKVNGSTNINKFSCTIPEYINPDTLLVEKANKQQRVKIKGAIILGVQNFDCKNAMMTSDLRKTLKAKLYPKLIITFEDLSNYPDPAYRGTAIKDPAHPATAITGFVTIELAGAVKRFEINYQYVMSADNNLKLIGSKQLNFSDFNIIPPKRLGGMIKTNNELDVEFMLNIKILN